MSLQISEVQVGADAAAAMGGSAAVAAGDVDVGSVTPLVASADAASFMISSNAKLDAVAVSDGGVAVSEGGIRTFTIALTSAPASGEVVEVSYTLGGSATSGADANSGDYVASVGGSGNGVPSGSSAGVVVLSSGATSVDVTISVNEDALSGLQRA